MLWVLCGDDFIPADAEGSIQTIFQRKLATLF